MRWLIWVFSSEYVLSTNVPTSVLVLSLTDFFYGTHSIGSDAKAHLSLLIWICTVYNFIYTCPGAESYDFFYGTHSIGSDAKAHVSLIIWIYTVYNLIYICPGAKYNDFFFYITPIFYFHLSSDESNGVFYGLHSIDSDEVVHASRLILICTDHILLTSVLVLSQMVISRYPQYRFRGGGSCESSHLNMFCLYFTFICPAAVPTV